MRRSYSESAFLQSAPELVTLCEQADHVDIKTVLGEVDLRTFLVNMWTYQPTWMLALYGIRAIFVRFLGMRQQRRPRRQPSAPQTVPMQVGKSLGVFKVRMVKEEQYWVAEAKDTHLNALLGVVMERVPNQLQKRFHVITIVSYNNWAGPVYFQVIRPFHHLVVGSMAIAGTQNPS